MGHLCVYIKNHLAEQLQDDFSFHREFYFLILSILMGGYVATQYSYIAPIIIVTDNIRCSFLSHFCGRLPTFIALSVKICTFLHIFCTFLHFHLHISDFFRIFAAVFSPRQGYVLRLWEGCGHIKGVFSALFWLIGISQIHK